MGLRDVLPDGPGDGEGTSRYPADALRVEAVGQAEEREDALRVEEERELRRSGRPATSSTCSAHGS